MFNFQGSTVLVRFWSFAATDGRDDSSFEAEIQLHRDTTVQSLTAHQHWRLKTAIFNLDSKVSDTLH